MMTTKNVNLFDDASKISAYTSAVFLLRFQQFCEGNFCNLISFYVRGELLLDRSDPSIDLNAKNDSGETANMIACQSGHQDIVQLIKSKLTLVRILDI